MAVAAYPGLGETLVLLVTALVAQAGVATALPLVLPGTNPILVAAFSNLIALSAVAAFGYFRSAEPPPWRGNFVHPAFAVGLVLVAGGGTVVLGEMANLTTWAFPLPAALAHLFNQLSGGNLAVSLFTVAVVAPLTEELLFRGLLLRGFTRRWGTGPGLVLSSALFALFHLNLWQAPTAFVAGLFLGWLFLKTGSLWYPMAAHALFNALPVVLAAAGFLVTGYNTPLAPGTVDLQPPLWTLGGTILLVLGLAMTRRWAPLSPIPVSDRVAP